MTHFRIDECRRGDGSPIFRIYVQTMKRKWVWDRLLPRKVDVGLVWEPWMVQNTLNGGYWWHASRDTWDECAQWVAQELAAEARKTKPEQVVRSVEIPS